jgi:3-deoxy-manno-octulosonate cytidylyltransferase (CMP-KDO synthetase)
MRCVVAIPARLESSRLPRKVLAEIDGKPMLQHVLERCQRSRSAAAVVLCTDSQELVDLAASWGINSLLTSPNCESGSERIAAVVPELVATGGGQMRDTLIINVQGDQPFIDPAVIDAMAAEFASRAAAPQVLTPVYRMGTDKIHNPNVVKTLLAADGKALYFSRSALPHVRGVDPEKWAEHATYWGHVGVYGYRADVLMRWADLPPSALEQSEKLEQLRLLEAGIQIGTFTVEGESLSVDTAEQLEQARAIAHSLRSRQPSDVN